jgi:3-phenylpropionate/trans-cinnamate dioxygenase ferredoxin reductase component
MAPSSGETFVIVGASLTGAKAAETLREEGFEGRLVLIGDEPVRPYERPPMSKSYLRGESSFDEAAVHPPNFYDDQNVELRTGTTVMSIDPAARQVVLESAATLDYDRVLLATGAAPRRLDVPGATLDGVLYLRTVEDSDAIRRAATASVPVVVIGAGWIGAEVAASARQLGAEVSMVEMASVPLERVLGPEVGAIYRDLHAEHGVDLHLGVGIDSIAGADGVEEVRLTDGTVLPAGAVIVGVGVSPRIELAEAAGLELDNGVVTDEHLASSVTGIYAAGDVANVLYPSYGTHIRLEHWSAALNQGPVAARNMLGQATAYDKIPYFYSDQYDLGMEYRGWAAQFDQVLIRGDASRREFIAFWLLGGQVRAAMNANVWDQSETIEALIRADQPFEPDRLTDTDVDLATLVAPPG